MSVGTDAADEEVDAAGFGNHLLVVGAFSFEVLGVTIEDMNVFLRAVDVVEEVRGHEGVVAFGVFLGKAHIFVHVKGDNVLEADAAFLAGSHEGLVHADG